MIFSLEALRARHGDCLLVHFGTPQDPRTILIDGGPQTVYADALKPRLRELREHLIALERIAPDDALPLALAMVSHIDDDHIGGMLALAEDEDGGLGLPHPSWVAPKTLWHNTFEQMAGAPEETVSEIVLERDTASKTSAVLASVKQGRELQAQAEKLGWPINWPLDGELVQAPPQGGLKVKLDEATSIVVLSPRVDEIEGLRKEWLKQMKRLRSKEAASAQVSAYLDKSPYNLSSLVCLLRQGDHTMLLTGDARGDLILKALDAAALTSNGELHVNVLKLPHHGSIRDVDVDFFQRITADHYVISGDGRYGNPESKTLEMITGSRKDDEFTIHLTYAKGQSDWEQRLTAFIAERDAKDRHFHVQTRAGSALSLSVDLREPPFPQTDLPA
jgi:beta-lactamase superfamily II metal-dependent hydrolase